jgi:putative protease
MAASPASEVARVLAPVAHPAEVEMLVENGAEELYAGLQLGGWTERFGSLLWVNRRGPTQGNSREPGAVREIIARASRLGVPVFLAMNSPTYTEEQLPVVAGACEHAVKELGAEAVIVADPGLMLALEERRVPFFVSSLGSSFNAETLRFYRDLGAERVILPRQVSIAEIAELRRRAPEVPVEAFIYNDPCVFDEGNCQTSHGAPGGAFCHLPFDLRVTTREGEPVADGRLAGRWATHLQEWQAFLRAAERDSTETSPTGAPLGACGLCAVAPLVQLGVVALKIVGREAAPLRKLRSVQLVSQLVKRARAGATAVEAAVLARQLRGDEARCAQGYSCYYRDIPRP